MKTISKSTELADSPLEFGDHLKIAHYELVMKDSYFTRVDEKDDNKIFEFFLINKREFFKKHFGEEPVIVHGFSHCKKKNAQSILNAIAFDLLKRYEKWRLLYLIVRRIRKFKI